MRLYNVLGLTKLVNTGDYVAKVNKKNRNFVSG